MQKTYNEILQLAGSLTTHELEHLIGELEDILFAAEEKEELSEDDDSDEDDDFTGKNFPDGVNETDII